MKKRLSMLLACLLLLTCTACGQEAPAQQTQPPVPVESDEEILARVETLVADGQYEAAYLDLLKVQGDGAEEWFQKLVYVPTSSQYSYSQDRTYQYDSQGRLTQYSYTIDGTYGDSHYVYTYQYDKQGRLTKKRGENRNSDWWEEVTYTYDKKGNLLTENGKDQDGITEQNTYTYDKAGRVKTHKWVQKGKSTSTRTTTYTYDKAGNCLIEDVRCGGAASTSSYTITNQYNSDNLLVSSVNNYETGLTYTDTYTYDEYGRLLQHDASGSGGRKTWSYTYDAKGKMVYQYFSNGQQTREHDYTYDSDGRLILDQWGKKSTEQETYAYDQAGNIIKRDEFQTHWQLMYYPDGVPQLVLEKKAELNPLYQVGVIL